VKKNEELDEIKAAVQRWEKENAKKFERERKREFATD
jgi:hypothetical protein